MTGLRLGSLAGDLGSVCSRAFHKASPWLLCSECPPRVGCCRCILSKSRNTPGRTFSPLRKLRLQGDRKLPRSTAGTCLRQGRSPDASTLTTSTLLPVTRHVGCAPPRQRRAGRGDIQDQADTPEPSATRAEFAFPQKHHVRPGFASRQFVFVTFFISGKKKKKKRAVKLNHLESNWYCGYDRTAARDKSGLTPPGARGDTTCLEITHSQTRDEGSGVFIPHLTVHRWPRVASRALALKRFQVLTHMSRACPPARKEGWQADVNCTLTATGRPRAGKF